MIDDNTEVSELTKQKEFDSLVQIRDLLFGQQLHEHNKKLESLSRAIAQESLERDKKYAELLKLQQQQAKTDRQRIASALRSLADELTRD